VRTGSAGDDIETEEYCEKKGGWRIEVGLAGSMIRPHTRGSHALYMSTLIPKKTLAMIIKTPPSHHRSGVTAMQKTHANEPSHVLTA
jgi:hypothetical protein